MHNPSTGPDIASDTDPVANGASPPPAVPAPRVVLDSNVWIDLLVFRDYLTAVLAHTENEIAAGRTREQIITLTNLPGFEDFHVQTGSRLPANLGAAYDELTAPRS